MSKKLASGADHIVLDVKVGSGAFMKDLDSARELAKAMVEIGKGAKRDTVATLTNMDQPLGCAVGNSLEVIEAIETLKGNGPEDFSNLCIELAAEIVLVSKIAENIEEARRMVKKTIENGEALDKLRQMIIYQGGNPAVIDDYTIFKQADEVCELVYENDEEMYIESIDALKVGQASVLLGAGRATKEDVIDHSVGILVNKKIGRKWTIIVGLVLLIFGIGAMTLITFLINNINSYVWVIYLLTVFIGIGWAMVNINSYPMIVEMSNKNNIGKFTGYYYTASMIAQTATPILVGLIMSFNTAGLRLLYLYSTVTMIIALLIFFFVIEKRDLNKQKSISKKSVFENLGDLD
ncbi:MAG: MFS transporter [Clostridia bacterium]|nr:MFS transporter [Clostridia bacterium]